MKNFEEIISELQPQLIKIDEIIIEHAKGKSELIKTITNHIINSGGKRIRPILHLLSHQLTSDLSSQNYLKNDTSQYYLAAAIELIHTATLLHDDVVDVSMIRRGRKTANAIWDNKTSILVGDFLFSLAFQMMVKTNNLNALELLAKTSSVIADGEVMQLEHSLNIDLKKSDYFEIIFGKTAILFSAACESAGIICLNKDSPINTDLREFGKNLGMVFQIVDDILDYSSDGVFFGKEIGVDFFEGKITLPLILGLQITKESDNKLLKSAIKESQNSNKKNHQSFNKVKNILFESGAIQAAKEEAKNFWILAKKNVDNIPHSLIKLKLEVVADFAFQRLV